MTSLTTEEIELFANRGYLVVKNLLDPVMVKRAVDYCWQRFPKHFDQNNPKSWHGEVTDSCMTLNILGRQGLVKFKDGVTNAIDVDSLLPTKHILNILRQLISDSVELDPPLVRGLYPIIPIPKLFSFPCVGHVEAHPLQIGTISYLQDVEVGGGAFSVWPGSHKEMYHAFDSKLGFIANKKYGNLRQYYDRLNPTQIPAKKGDAIFFHHRLLHAPSNNNSQKIRFAYLCDFRPINHQELCYEKPRELWEDWPKIKKLVDEGKINISLSENYASSYLRRFWVNSPKLRKLILGFLLNEEAKKRSAMSKAVRNQKTVDDWYKKSI